MGAHTHVPFLNSKILNLNVSVSTDGSVISLSFFSFPCHSFPSCYHHTMWLGTLLCSMTTHTTIKCLECCIMCAMVNNKLGHHSGSCNALLSSCVTAEVSTYANMYKCPHNKPDICNGYLCNSAAV